MKQTLLVALFIVLVSPLYAQDEIRWMSMNEALAAQKKVPKKIIMDVYTSWCGPCKLLDKNTFGNKDVIKFVNNNYYPVKFNAEGTESITYQDFTYTNPNYQEAKISDTLEGSHGPISHYLWRCKAPVKTPNCRPYAS